MRRDFRWHIPARMNIAELCLERHARAEPGATMLIHVAPDGTSREWSRQEISRASNRFANALRAAGVARGDRVGLMLSQGPEVLIAHMAIFKLGAVSLPLFTLFGPDALAYRLKDSGARVVVTDRDNLDKLPGQGAPNGAGVVFCTDPGPQPAGVRDFWADLGAASDRFAMLDTAADDPAVLIYTSGTTGSPKGVLHAHRFLLGHMPLNELSHGFFPQPGDRGWTPADWAWIGGLMDLAMPCLLHGVPLVSCRMRKFDPGAALGLMARHGVRNSFLPPTALRLMRHEPVPGGLRLRSIASGGESLGADLLDWGSSRLGVEINEIYGQTECNLVIGTCRQLEPVPEGTMGRAVPGHDVAIIDAAGQPLPPGELGEIAVRAPDPVMFLQYWGKPDETAAKFDGEWMRTGDLGRCDETGLFTFEGRDDDVITSAGYRIGPTEIENCVLTHPDVIAAAAVGVPDARRTEIVKLFAVLRPGASREGLEEALVEMVRSRVSPHVAPRAVEWIDSLPTTATGKVMRRALRDRDIP
ncbi:AMP-dependent synthetase [Brevirhabdus pacifica]|uniref:AMP-dependent synthetase n=2 Tax=Brevirhabdus pacifica TaxID=1267768 RepID=A0A1U7DL28_9RHOB|nr:AMP-binding protein [Brevirhabdus pacifica]APX90593.1 AMP-dependent synthetase [Brevirhabdus pacifica]OWU78411.1 AMP-dependent synthetase [Loktanella sp. 22II-4b]